MKASTRVKEADVAGDCGTDTAQDLADTTVNADADNSSAVNQITDQQILDEWAEQRAKRSAPIAKAASFRGIARMRSLMASIHKTGQIEKGKKTKSGLTYIGNHREVACRLLGLQFAHEQTEYDDNDPHVIEAGTDSNAEGRRDTQGQAICTAVRTRLFHEAIQKDRPFHPVPTYEALAEKFTGSTRSHRSVSNARAVHDACPALFDCIEQDLLAVYRAKEIIDDIEPGSWPKAVKILAASRGEQDEYANEADPWEGDADERQSRRAAGQDLTDDILRKAREARQKKKEKEAKKEVDAKIDALPKAPVAPVAPAAKLNNTSASSQIKAPKAPKPLPKTAAEKVAEKAQREADAVATMLANAHEIINAASDEKSRKVAQRRLDELQVTADLKRQTADAAKVTADIAAKALREEAERSSMAARLKMATVAYVDAQKAADASRTGGIQAAFEQARMRQYEADLHWDAVQRLDPSATRDEPDDLWARLLRKFPTAAELGAALEKL